MAINDAQKRELESLLFEGGSTSLRFGCVLFDLQGEEGKKLAIPGSGWASIEGKIAERIHSTSDLSSNVRWWSNLSKETYWKVGLHKQPKIKPSSYFSTEMGLLMKEIGLNPKKIATAEVCEKLSALFSKVMSFAREFYPGIEFLGQDLGGDLRNVLLPKDDNISLHVDEALTRSYQDFVTCNSMYPKPGWRSVVLRRPRYFHASRVMETSIPLYEGEWDFLGKDDLPAEQPERLQFLLDQDKPFIAMVSTINFFSQENIRLELGGLLSLGEAIGDKGVKKRRNWVPQTELLYLSKFAELQIDAVFMARGYGQLPNIVLPDLGELSDFSISLGLLAESLWMGLSGRSINPQTRSKTLVSPRACWLRATDRFLSLTSAMILSASGYQVLSYGCGSVSVAVQEGKLAELMEIAPHAGVCLPMWLLDGPDQYLF